MCDFILFFLILASGKESLFTVYPICMLLEHLVVDGEYTGT